jgi:hypothetical protein
MPRKDNSEQGEESLAERLDALQATNASKFSAINDTLQRLDDHILANDNHLFTTNAHQQATNKNLANLKRDIDKRFDNVTAKLEDSNAKIEQLMSSLDTCHANVTAQGRARQDLLPAPTMWMTMRIPNNLVLKLTSMVLMVHIATMANNKAIMNIFIKITINHNMISKLGESRASPSGPPTPRPSTPKCSTHCQSRSAPSGASSSRSSST